MKYILLFSIFINVTALSAEKKDDWVDYSPDYVTTKWMHVSIPDEKCINIAQDIVRKSDKKLQIKLIGKKYKSAIVKGEFELMVNCINMANRVNVVTDRVKTPEHQKFFDTFVHAYEKFNKSKQ